MALLTINRSINEANNFIQNVSDKRHAYYFYAGRANPWSNDSSPPLANGSVSQIEQTLYDDLLFGKLIANNNVSFMIPKYVWTSNTVYTAYNQNDPNIYDENFYVITNKNEVYKCIFNNGGIPSTFQPDLNSTYGTFTTGDGYIWKYMYTVGNGNTFVSNTYIPIATDVNVSGNSVPGTIDSALITNGGSNYQIYQSNTLVSVISSQKVIIPFQAPTDNYFVGSSIYLNAGLGSGQIRQIVSSNATEKSVSVSPSNPFQVFNILNLSSYNGTIQSGSVVSQPIVKMNILNLSGILNTGDIFQQTDSTDNGTLISANGTTIELTGAGKFANTSLPIFDTAYSAGTTKSGTVNIISGNNWVMTNSGTNFTTDYAVGNFIRVGSNANNNLRRITSVNSTVLICESAFNNNLIANGHVLITNACDIVSPTYLTPNASISNTNLNSVTISIANSSSNGSSFILGENILLVNAANTYQGANGICAYSNTSTVILSQVGGINNWTNNYFWSNSYFLQGQSSLLTYNLQGVTSSPSITVYNQNGTFINGAQIAISLNGANTGNAVISSQSTIPNALTQYIIGPSVNITSGDGLGFLAIATVNQTNNANTISGINVINPGYGYTFANLAITCNSLYGSGATITPVISPLEGHGYDAIRELGARYIGTQITFDTGANESYYFPSFVSYRRVGILQDPEYADVTVTLNNFSRATLSLYNANTSSSNWIPGEVVIQSNTNAYGIVVSGNNTYLQLKGIGGPINQTTPYFANNATNTYIYGYSSNAHAYVSNASTNYFHMNSNTEIVSEFGSGAKAIISQLISNTSIKLTNVIGQFQSNDTLVDYSTNTYATVTSIKTANGTKDQTTIFATKFNDCMRLTLTSNNGAFMNYEYVQQDVTGANGFIISTNNDIDLSLSTITGSFANGNILHNSNASANGTGTILFSNSSYIKLTNVSNNFNPGDIVSNGSVTATINTVYPVLIMNNINGNYPFQPSTNNITGQTSGAVGICNGNTLISYPELVRETGKVIYSENMSPIQRSANTAEQFNIVIKF